MRFDFTDAEAIRNLPEQVPILDVIFNCVGYVYDGALLEANDDVLAWF